MAEPWRKGMKQNAGPGRMPGKGLAKWIRTWSEDGLKIAKWCADILEGRVKGATLADKRWAAEWLSNRAFGKSPDVVLNGELADGDNPLSELPSEVLRAIAGGVPFGALGQNAPTSQNSDTPTAPNSATRASAVPTKPTTLDPVATEPVITQPSAVDPNAKCAECGLRRAHAMDCGQRTLGR